MAHVRQEFTFGLGGLVCRLVCRLELFLILTGLAPVIDEQDAQEQQEQAKEQPYGEGMVLQEFFNGISRLYVGIPYDGIVDLSRVDRGIWPC